MGFLRKNQLSFRRKKSSAPERSRFLSLMPQPIIRQNGLFTSEPAFNLLAFRHLGY
jgi:hypothetical protein